MQSSSTRGTLFGQVWHASCPYKSALRLAPEALARESHMPSEVGKLSFLHVLESIVLVIASLYWARAVFVPLALALMLTFLLQPIVAALHRRGLGYTPAAVLVVLLLAPAPGALSWGAGKQASGLAFRLPAYQGNLRPKLHDLLQAGPGRRFRKVHQTRAEP